MLKNMKIRNKTILGFVLVLLLTAAISVLAILNINTIAKNVQILFDSRYMRSDAIAIVRRRLPEIKAALLQAAVTEDAQAKQKAVDNAIYSADRVKIGMTSWKEILTAANDTAMLEKYAAVEKDVAAINSIREKAQQAVLANDQKAAIAYVLNDFIPVSVAIEDQMTVIRDTERQAAKGFVADADSLKGKTMLLLFSILGGVGLLIVVITIVITNSISKPMTEMVTVTNKMAQGDLHVAIEYNSKNEFGQLANGMSATVHAMRTCITNIAEVLGKMADGDLSVLVEMDYVGDFAQIKTSVVGITDSLNDILTQIYQSSNQVLSGANQVSSAAQALSQGATEQASSLEELSATIQDISNQITQNAANAQSAKNIAVNSSKSIEHANVQMTDLIKAMESINDTSRKISKIIKTIDEIAFQTNILALNAAVEAARAGEAGKGFAVVADEVRNLASKSAEAAKDTTVLIENSIQAVNKGTKIAGETAKSLVIIVDDAKRSADLISLISEASSMQANAIKQTTMGVEQISTVVQTNSATAEESAAASEELSGQADMLNQLVGKFKLRHR